MARIFITGSADGLGQLAATQLLQQGHAVVLHARNAQRASEALNKNPGAAAVLHADLSSIAETTRLADAVNALGSFDAVIHNAGVYQAPPQQVFAVNTVAPYILTALITKPQRLIYLSSGMHLQGHAKLEHFGKSVDRINYSDSKLHVLMLALAVAGKWKDVYSNAVDPGWVPTKMGGKGAPGNLQQGYATQVWLATSEDEQAKVSGCYFHHQQVRAHHTQADNASLQEQFIRTLETITGVGFPL